MNLNTFPVSILMISRFCIFTMGFAYNRQGLIDYLSKIMPPNVELFLFITNECKGKYVSSRFKIYESSFNKYSCFSDFGGCFAYSQLPDR